MKSLVPQYLSRVSNTRSENTSSTYSGILEEVFGIVDVLTPETLDQLLSHWRSVGNSSNTIILKMSCLKSFLKFARRRIEIPDYDELVDVLSSVKKEKRIQSVMSKEELEVLLDAARGIRYKCIVAFGAYCGLRVSEVLSLKTADIYDDYCIVRDTKNHKDRKVLFVSQKHKDYLNLYMEKYSPTEMLFDVKQNSLQAYFKELCVAQGFPEYHFHTLRHFFVQSMLNAEVSLPVIASFTGHSSLSSLQSYVSITPKMIAKANIFDQ